ncbi:glycoside hydrolase [Streptomyces qinglanensis]|uniref:Glycoside hydrolase n=1 Tax=Streptomyces qinglanensis TaxID=943816 RepID=A0A1E7K707_9ACTN|nr:glycoside hydrolase family 15 protein [Streptomyces qinglanensis]OEU99728.1 glycoside hydrolase [Streptomyces qinglanensis]OEV24152.1 glycoside hydrolase [Streptomyces nanshensis]
MSTPRLEAPPPQTLRDYALIADGERGALIGGHGDISWMCAPRWDSDAVFSSLIGGRGHYTIRPRGRFVWGGYYEGGALIWRSRWVTQEGIVECREAMAFPGDPHRAVLLRRIIAVQGPAHVTAALAPYAGFGAEPPERLRHEEDGTWTGNSAALRWRWRGADRACPRPGPSAPEGLDLRLDLRAGEQHDLVLELSDAPLPSPEEPSALWSATEESWKRAEPRLAPSLAPEDARHAYTLLRGMTSRTGGMVGAATTSLPERAEEGRNYDYRYVWIRDQSFAGQAAAVADGDPLLDAAVDFISARLHQDGPRMAPAYTLTGGRIPDQRTLGLPGYPGGFDRVGNWVTRQFQLDAFGEALLLFAAAHRKGRLDRDGWCAAQIAVDAISRRRHEPDAGVWELPARHWTHSRLICVAGLRALAAAAPAAEHVGAWSALADSLLAETAATSLHPSGRWQRAPDDPGLDAALLLPPVRGGLPADDPRVRRTLSDYARELTRDHYAYRFRHDERPLADAEGAFLLCGHAMALAEHQQGHREEALRWFERNRAACGPPGLFTEEYDIGQRQLRGNLPQAFVHALMLETATRLAAHPRPGFSCGKDTTP